MIEIMLFISVLLYTVVAILAIRLIRITKASTAWILIVIGIVIIAIVRITDILPFVSIELTHKISHLDEWIGIFISIVMVAGVVLIQSLFRTIRELHNALRDSVEKYRSLANTADPMYMIDRNFNYTFMNDKQLSRFPLPLNTIKGRSYGEFHSKDETNEFKQIVERVFTTSIPIQDEYRSNIDNQYFLRTFSPVTNTDGTATIAITVVLKDISDRKQMEKNLIESEQRLRNLLQGSPIPTYVIGLDHKVLYWNKALEELTRIKAEEIIGTTYHWRAFYSDKRPCIADLLVDQTLDTIPQFYSNKWRKSKLIEEAYEATDFFPKLGNCGKWLHFTAAAIRDSQGDLFGAIATLEDVSERKLNELALRNSELRLQSVIQGSPIPTFVIGKDHRVIYWNKALEELSGIKAEEVIGTTDCYRSFYSEKRPALADLMVDQALEAIPQWYFEKYTKSSLLDEAYEATDFFPELKGGGKWVRFTAAVIRDSQGNLVGAVETLEDVSERKRAEEQLSLVKKLESLGIFADGIAHDFNNFLSIMLRNIFAAQLSLADEQDGLWRERLEFAEKAGFQAKELVHRLITFAKGGEPIRKIGCISDLLMESVDLSLSSSNVICEFSLPSDLWLIEMDDVQIRQVIYNLVVNAQEAMPEGGTITIDAENVSVTADCGLPLKEGNYVKWSVKDHGTGIPQENLQRIWDPYFTTKPIGSARGKGMGLAISYSIVKRHDGFIDFKSEPGVGSNFSVYLPASLQGDSIEKARKYRNDTRGGRILLMDDDETVRNAAGIVLNYLGYDVEYAKDGREAIDLYRTAIEKGWPFCAVILDLYVSVSGGIGGKEAMRELLAIDPCIRAIVSSGYSDDPVVSEFRKYGFLGTVDVPYDVEKMERILDNLVQENLLDNSDLSS
ncbi:MAG: PAS domain S-box protein [Syntrophobacteraceae bacterium]